MRYDEFSKEVRFSYFLPYGIVSHHALVLAVHSGDDAYIEYIPGVPMQEQVRICENAHMRRLRALRAMRDYGYIEEREKASGMEEWQNILFYKLTKAGLYFLTNNIDPALEEKRILNIRQDKSRKKRETGSYLPENLEAFEIGRELYDLAIEKTTNEQKRAQFELFLFESADMCKSLLATQPALAQKVHFTTPKGYQLYRYWRLANAEALFRINDYLTSIDRRPLCPVNPYLPDKESYSIMEFCEYALSVWYKDHPNSYRYLNPWKDGITESEWQSTPAFYAVKEIPGITRTVEIIGSKNQVLVEQLIQHVCIGIAIGKKANYIVHHTRSRNNVWQPKIEQTCIEIFAKCIDEFAENKNLLGANRTISSAIIICPSVKQFAALFPVNKRGGIGTKGKASIVGQPYSKVFLIPLNHSGAMQLRWLMAATPANVEVLIKKRLLKHKEFSERPVGIDRKNNIFTLSYKKTPVLVAHMMEWQTLTWALEHYQAGRKFYISCYPEQVKFIQKIMPNAEFI